MSEIEMTERDPVSRSALANRDDPSGESDPAGEQNHGGKSAEGLDTKSSSKKAPPSNTLANAVPVSNTSPLLNLAVTGHLELLRECLGEVVIPPAVRQELRVDEGRPESEMLGEALKAGWLRERAARKERSLSALLQSEIDRGESETIALAVELSGRRVPLRRGRWDWRRPACWAFCPGRAARGKWTRCASLSGDSAVRRASSLLRRSRREFCWRKKLCARRSKPA